MKNSFFLGDLYFTYDNVFSCLYIYKYIYIYIYIRNLNIQTYFYFTNITNIFFKLWIIDFKKKKILKNS